MSRIGPSAESPPIGSTMVWDGTKWIECSLTGSSAGPGVVGVVGSVREDSILRYKPFILKCPSCSAPTVEGTTKCKYCDVPLRWEPVHSLSRDDKNWKPDQEDEIDPDVFPLGFGPTMVNALSRTAFQVNVQLTCRPTHLYVPPSLADHFSIVDLRIGKDSQGSPNPVPASWYSTGRGSPVACDTATIGVFIALIVDNKTHCNRNFEAVLRCKTIRAEPFRAPVHPLDMVRDLSKLRPWEIAPGSWRAGAPGAR